MADEADVLRIIETPITQSSDGEIRWSVDHTGWFPMDATSVSSCIFTLKDISGNVVEGKVTDTGVSSLLVTFTLSALAVGAYTLYGKATANTGDVDTWSLDVFVPY